jgi:phosphatidate cytidylyltransferase
MLQTRVLIGSLLALWGFAVLFLDTRFAPWYPILFFFAVAVLFALGHEIRSLLPSEKRPRLICLWASLLLMIAANWSATLGWPGSPWVWVLAALTASLIILFLVEASLYQAPGSVTERLACTFFCLGYVGLFGSYLIQLRWFRPGGSGELGASTLALLLAIFIPKCCDIGAYFTGRLLGKHRMTPLLSPKKTWEGAAGGLLLSALVALFVTQFGAFWIGLDDADRPVFPLSQSFLAGLPGWLWSLLFGLTIGLMGLLGDLMESLLKRDLRQKDAGASVPGFGGLLDVFDSILFSAPVSYAFLQTLASFMPRPG